MRNIDDTLYSLVTRRGFVDAFWKELRRRRAERPETSHQEVFYYLEDLYEEEFGTPQFGSFGAFRKWRDRNSMK